MEKELELAQTALDNATTTADKKTAQKEIDRIEALIAGAKEAELEPEEVGLVKNAKMTNPPKNIIVVGKINSVETLEIIRDGLTIVFKAITLETADGSPVQASTSLEYWDKVSSNFKDDGLDSVVQITCEERIEGKTQYIPTKGTNAGKVLTHTSDGLQIQRIVKYSESSFLNKQNLYNKEAEKKALGNVDVNLKKATNEDKLGMMDTFIAKMSNTDNPAVQELIKAMGASFFSV